MSWRRVPLGSVADIQLGKMLSPKARTGVSSYPYLRNVNVQWGRLDFSDLIEMDFDEEDRAKFSLKQGDLLVCEGGEPGRCAVVERDQPGVFFQKALMRVRPRDSRLDTRFLQRFMAFAAERGTFARHGNQATIAHFPAVKLSAFEVPLPPLPEQRRIADILDKADAVRRKRQEAIALTEELLRSAFLKMVGPHASDYSTWREVTLETLAHPGPNTMRTGPFGSDLRHSEFVDTGVAVLGIDNAVQNRFVWGERRYITQEKYEGLKRYTVRPHDVIITIMGTTGRSAVVPEDIPLAITTKHLATLTLNRALAEPEFVAQAIHRHPAVLAQVHKANRGAIMSGLNLGLIKSLVVRLPPIEYQQRFAALTTRVRELGRRLESAQGEADGLFAALVQRAFRGELTAKSTISMVQPQTQVLDASSTRKQA
ncbi:restriction endonuclease subunit S [Polyangium sp. 15x6]|uniref:restriction endonuclease subunit S n=1 Tax=Polyangium sp. 15x6 TaxID=3042687 RepID=UPI00249B049E|nr:restriction endonuclease subunit S [Polyangium sp. 15x6]MDI3289760.1 restriction endonuclease subunit S [Polyangium sp. 15x6]